MFVLNLKNISHKMFEFFFFKMTDNEILTDLETFNDAMVHFKEAVDGKGKN